MDLKVVQQHFSQRGQDSQRKAEAPILLVPQFEWGIGEIWH
jgi:hypothetical protein